MNAEAEMRAALENFQVEAAELLADMEAGLLELESGGGDDETVNSVFRAAHTVKGSAGLFGLDDIVSFTHVMESVLERLRSGEIPVTSELVGALLPCTDHLGALIGRLAGGPAPDPAAGDALLSGLAPFLLPRQGEPGPERVPGATGTAVGAAGGVLHLSLRFGPESLRDGLDPLAFLNYLTSIGELVRVRTLHELLPEADDVDAEVCYLAFQVTLATTSTPAEVANVFEFVREDGDIRILAPGADAAECDALVESFGELGDVVRQALADSGLTPAGEAPATEVTPADSGEPDPTAPDDAFTERRAVKRESSSIRVDAERLDRLIDAVGELVIAGAGAGLRVRMAGDEQLEHAFGEVTRLLEEVRNSTLQLRMVPIGTTFSRFQRVVRDVSAGLGKDVTLVIHGGDTEVDKALVERIGDPLMHLVRNALDHGIEAPDVRAGTGKSRRGTLSLNAFHDSGSIVIEVRDDGAGIDPARVLAKAVERGLVDAGAQPTTPEIYSLLFEPGFSTAAQVSDLSGRGVGMDVVKRNVTALRGTIEVDSTPGAGSTFRIRLPLTLAIIDGFLVGVGEATYIIPLDQVIECVELPAGDSPRSTVMNLRGEVLPYVRLRSMFAVPGERPRRENVVVVEHAGSRVGLVVDSLGGEFQTVIKPLGQLFEHVRGIGGSTILGDGDVALIIDVPMLVQHAHQTLARRTA